MEDLNFDYEYSILVVGKSGKTYGYNIEADSGLNALNVTKEFFRDDYPEDEIRFMRIENGEEIK